MEAPKYIFIHLRTDCISANNLYAPNYKVYISLYIYFKWRAIQIRMKSSEDRKGRNEIEEAREM